MLKCVRNQGSAKTFKQSQRSSSLASVEFIISNIIIHKRLHGDSLVRETMIASSHPVCGNSNFFQHLANLNNIHMYQSLNINNRKHIIGYTLLKQKYVIHTFLVWFSSLHRTYHFLVCYAYYRYVIHTQNGMKCTL